MTDTPFAPGGIVHPDGPDSDLISVRLSPGEPVIRRELFLRYKAGELSMSEMFRLAEARPDKEEPNGSDHS
jgi:hypothetical protein